LGAHEKSLAQMQHHAKKTKTRQQKIQIVAAQIQH
jgi:hypothetical protein